MSKKVIVLNAPAGAGKDTLANEIQRRTGFQHLRFKTHLYECAATLFNINLHFFVKLAVDEKLKEVPIKMLEVGMDSFFSICNITKSNRAFTTSNGKVPISPREALIFVSECVIKPNMGEDYFGRMAAISTKTSVMGSVFSDGGFQSEVKCLTEEVGEENLYIVQFSRGDKIDFRGDSRDWLRGYGKVNIFGTTNNGEVYEIVDKIIDWVQG
jgi:hypothetical protein